MAKQLKKIFNAGTDEVVQNFTINSWHVSQSVDALTGAEDYDITISGSLEVEGPLDLTDTDSTTGQTNFLVLDGTTVKTQTGGNDGTSGSSGSSGTSGSSGSSGTSGTSGESVQGPQGESGSSGSSGTSGSSGSSGTSGSSGSSGTSGNTCYQYNVTPSTSGESTLTYDSCDCSNSEATLIILPTIDCGTATSFSGNVGYPVQQPINFGTDTGSVVIAAEAYSVPDRFIMVYNGVIAADTGYRGGTQYQYGGSSRASFTGSLSQSVDPSTGLTYPFTGSANDDDGYPTVTFPGNTNLTFEKNVSSVTFGELKVYAPMNNTAWNADIGCPGGAASPVGEDNYYAQVFATSTPTVSSGETDVVITCMGIAGSVNSVTPSTSGGGGGSNTGNGNNAYLRAIQSPVTFSINESLTGYTLEVTSFVGVPAENEIMIARDPSATGQIKINTGSAGYDYVLNQTLNNSGSIRIAGATADFTFSDLGIAENGSYITVTYNTLTTNQAGSYVQDETPSTFDADAAWYEFSIPRGYNELKVLNLSDTNDNPFVLRAGSDMNFGDDAFLEIYNDAAGARFDLMYAYNNGHVSRSFEDGISGNALNVGVGKAAVAKVSCWASGSNTKGLVGVKADLIIT